MFKQDDVKMLATELPSNAIMEIHKQTKISRPTIYKFLRGEKIRSKSAEIIYLLALKIIAREKHREKQIKTQQEKVFSIR
jgi:hypothetical protein